MDYRRFLSRAALDYQESAIRRTGALAGKVPDLISFAPGYPAAELFPWDELKAITTELLDRREGSTLQYGATRGYRPLIEEVIRHLSTRGITTRAEEMVITTDRVELAKQAADLCSGVFDQRLVHAAFERGVVDALAPRLRAHYRDKRTVMEEALRATLGDRVRWSRPRGGFFIWAEFEPGIDDRELLERAIEQKVSFVIGSAFYVNGDPSTFRQAQGRPEQGRGATRSGSSRARSRDEGHRFARLSFSAPTPERIREGITRLGKAVSQGDREIREPITGRSGDQEQI